MNTLLITVSVECSPMVRETEVQSQVKSYQSKERSNALPYNSMLQLLKRDPLDYPRLRSGEETRWQLHKNAACNPEQVLAATPHKTPTVRPPAPYHENYSS